MNLDSIKNTLINLKDLLISLFKNGLVTFLLGIIVATLTASLNNPYYLGLISVASICIIIFVIYLIYYAKKRYVSINYRAKYYVYYLNSLKTYLFETPLIDVRYLFYYKIIN